jgi:hypothetical protein
MLSLESELRRTHALRRWEERLQQTDSVFARLVFVSQLRDASGRYMDSFLLRSFSDRTCHQIIANAHRQIFREWLQLSARSKLRDLRKYNDAICQGATAAKEAAWTSLCREVIPSGISITELNFFCDTAQRLAHIVCRNERGQSGNS